MSAFFPARRSGPRARRVSITTKLATIILVFVLAIAALVAVVAVSLHVANGVRAYVAGEGLWSKGQKDAVYYLMRYARSRQEQDYEKYREALGITLGDRMARQELLRPQYDRAVAELGFVQGGNAPEDVASLIFLFRQFGEVSYFERAVAIWIEADGHIDQLMQAAEELRRAMVEDRLSPEREREILDRVEQINTRVTRLEREFSATLGEGARWARDVLLAIVALSAIAVLAVGVLVSGLISRGLRAGILCLREGAIRVAAGDLQHPIAADSRDELGELAAVFNDMIAHRRHAEDALKSSMELTRSVIQTAYDAFVAIDAEGRVVEWNRQAEITFGWPREQVLNQLLAEFVIPPQHRAAHTRGLQHYLRTGEGPLLDRRIEITAMHRDGREFPVEMTIWPVRADSGPRFNAFLHDISERHRAVQRLAAQKSAAAALVESSTLDEAGPALIQAVCEALDWAAGAIWTPDRSINALRCVEFWHRPDVHVPQFEHVSRTITFAPGIGLPGRVWQSGKPLWIADVTRDSNFPRAKYAEQDRLHGAFGFPLLRGTEVLGLVEFFSHAIQEPDEDLLKMMHTLGNLLGQFMARTGAEAELAARAKELARSNAELEQFAYVASHDLQEPLRSVNSYAQLLARRFGGHGNTEADEFVSYITDAVQRMRDLIDGLLAYSRISRKDQPFDVVDFNRVFDTALANLKGAIEHSGALVTHEDLPTLRADRQSVTQLFQNLIGNAIKFRSQAAPRVQVGARRNGTEWQFFVQDNGIGIDPQYADRVFALFQRLHTRDQYTGSGIGLAICKKIVERHGGRIWVEPATPGSVFHFTLPAG